MSALTSWALIVALVLISVGLLVIRAELRTRRRDRRIAARIRDEFAQAPFGRTRYWDEVGR